MDTKLSEAPGTLQQPNVTSAAQQPSRGANALQQPTQLGQLGALLQPNQLVSYQHEMQFLHPHPLTLEPNHEFGCYACDSKQREGFVFRCHKCDFNIHLECTFISKEDQRRMVYTHQHPLMRFINVPKDRILCHFCGKCCSEPTYACFPCNLFLHPSCNDPGFPREIEHFYHTCPLSLSTYNPDEFYSRRCRACYQPLQPRTFYYGCVRCGFEMHLDCTLFATTTDKSSTEERIQHFLHGHPLSLIKDGGESSSTSVTCYACRKCCTNIPTYACLHPSCRNKVYICTTCKELPEVICHPFHPYHNLTLLQQYNPDLQQVDWTAPLPGTICNVCRKDSNIVVYICQSEKCNFRLHVGCSEMRASIQYEGRNHLLHVKEIIDAQVFNCSDCKSTTCDSHAFSCLHLNCDFNLHLMCGPLPSTIKHKCHVHHLILTQYSLATFENEEDDEFCCDACEEDRDPLLPIYQCKECKFAAEVNCIISEVILSLKGEYGGVDLRNPNGQLVRMVTKEAAERMVHMQEKEKQLEPDLILYEVLQSLSEDEKKELGSVLEAIERETATAKEILSCDPDEVVLFSDKAYKQFIQFLDHDDGETPIDKIHLDQGSFMDLIERFSSKFSRKEETVNVSCYTTTHKLAPILKHLLSDQYGDISDKSSLSPRVKGFLFHMLCEYVYNMKNIKVVEITHDLLLNWWAILKTLQRAGFRIQFAVDHFKRVSRAHFGLYVNDEVENALDEIDRDISQRYKDIQALEVKRKSITSAKSTKSNFIEKCLREGWSLKRWRAGTGLP